MTASSTRPTRAKAESRAEARPESAAGTEPEGAAAHRMVPEMITQMIVPVPAGLAMLMGRRTEAEYRR